MGSGNHFWNTEHLFCGTGDDDVYRIISGDCCKTICLFNPTHRKGFFIHGIMFDDSSGKSSPKTVKSLMIIIYNRNLMM